jgi:hypothetical protein
MQACTHTVHIYAQNYVLHCTLPSDVKLVQLMHATATIVSTNNCVQCSVLYT